MRMIIGFTGNFHIIVIKFFGFVDVRNEMI